MAKLDGTRRTVTAAATTVVMLGALVASLPAAAQVHSALRGKRLLHQAASPEVTPLQVLSELIKRLQLTDEQRQSIKAIISAHKDEIVADVTAEQSGRAALRQAIRQPAADTAGVTGAAATVAQADAQLSLLRATVFAELYAVLSDAQRQELAAFTAEAKAKLLDHLGDLGGGHADPAALLQRGGNRLGLSPEQKDQIAAILAADKGELTSIATAEVATHAALAAAIHRPTVDEAAVRRAGAAVAAADLRLDLERAHLFSQIWGVLTSEQQGQLTDLLAAAEGRIAARVETFLNIFKLIF
jgi:Spy/CpxP family protein refolding chaperone